ncbi:transmembrane drug/metabolite transporter family protein [Ruegeria lacuscaerulensis ITI-1157]|nr:transmembrane drug/metabolite transporter family protein [Ruegeria lacuscaerulensis ITI-1157]SHI63530.1 Permease of the drug/metabolite transporter (DMT) superfamily [Ruegeria lacuscaerulensis ITI-1157]
MNRVAHSDLTAQNADMTRQKALSLRNWAELGLLGFIWGASFLSIRIALDTVPVMTTVFHRVFWAAAVLWIVIIAQRQGFPTSPKVWCAFFVMGLLNNVLPFSLMAWGQLHVETGLTSILNAATAVFGVLAAALMFPDERLTPTRLIGVVLGFAGVTVAIGPGNLLRLDLQSMGQLAILAGTVSYAGAAVWARIYLSDLPPQVSAAGMLTGSAVIMAPIMLWVDGPPSLDISPEAWLAIGYYSAIATACAYLLYYRVLASAGSGNLLLVTLIIPPVAITLGALVRNEALPPNAYAGFAILATGLLILSRSGRRD